MTSMLLKNLPFFSQIRSLLQLRREGSISDFHMQVRIGNCLLLPFFSFCWSLYDDDYPMAFAGIHFILCMLKLRFLQTKQSLHLVGFFGLLCFFLPLLYLVRIQENIVKVPLFITALHAYYSLQNFPSILCISYACINVCLAAYINVKMLPMMEATINDAIPKAYMKFFDIYPICVLIYLISLLSHRYIINRTLSENEKIKEDLKKSNKKLKEINKELEKTVKKLEKTNKKLIETNNKLGFALKSQDLFVACVSHELRNPLNAMVGNIEILQLEIKHEKWAQMLHVCEICTEVLSNLINNLLDVAKIRAGRMEISPIPTQTTTLLEKVWNISKGKILQKDLIGTLNISRNFPLFLKLDSHRVMQILLNLLSNSTKFTSKGSIKVYLDWKSTSYTKGGSQELDNDSLAANTTATLDTTTFYDVTKNDISMISFSSEEVPQEIKKNEKISPYAFSECSDKAFMTELNEQGFITFEANNVDFNNLEKVLPVYIKQEGLLKIIVSDTGIGIPKEAQKRIFEPFIQSDSSVTRRFGGTGLGLYIVRKLIEKMGGDISMASYEGLGTQFVIHLPVSTITQDEKASIERSNAKISAKALRASSLGNLKTQEVRKVLIVEDSAFNQNIMETYMKNLGLEADIVSNGHEGLMKFCSKGEKYYVFVVLDIQMPVMDGITCAKKIREFEKNIKRREVPIIFVTGNATELERNECLRKDGGIRARYFYRKPFVFTDCKLCVENILGSDPDYANSIARKVLIADDEPFNRDIMVKRLEKLNVECIACCNGAEACEKIRNESGFKLIILDYEMPGMNGLEATKVLKKIMHEKGIKIKIIGMTGSSDQLTLQMCYDVGMDKVFTKPITFSVLEAIVEEYLL